jgi:hypothetical protein
MPFFSFMDSKDVKTNASGVAALFAPDADDGCIDERMDVECAPDAETSLDRRFLLDLKPKAISKYIEFLKEQLLCGEGEAMVELGVSLDNSTDKGSLFLNLEED